MLTKADILAAFSAADRAPSSKTNKELIKEFLSGSYHTVVDEWELKNDYAPLKSENVDSSSSKLRTRFLSGFYHRKEPVCTQYAFNGCHSLLFISSSHMCLVHAYEREKETLRLKWLCGDSPLSLNHEEIHHVIDCHILLVNTEEVVALRERVSKEKLPFRNLETALLCGGVPKEYCKDQNGNDINFEFIIICNDLLDKTGITTIRSLVLQDFLAPTEVLLPTSSRNDLKYTFSISLNPYELDFTANLDYVLMDIHPKIQASHISGVRYVFNEELDFSKTITLKRRLAL